MQGDVLDFPKPPATPSSEAAPPTPRSSGSAAVALERADTIPPPSGDNRLKSTPPEGRRISRAERRQQQRRRIELAAASVFAQNGLHAASVEQILQTANVSRSTFYRYFGNLDEVLLSVKRTAAQLFVDTIEQRVRACERTPEKIRVAINTYLDLVGQYGDFARVLHREQPGTTAANAGIRRAALERLIALFKSSIEDAMNEGYILSIPDDVTVRALVLAIDGIAAEYLEKGDEHRAHEAAPGLIGLCYRTLGA